MLFSHGVMVCHIIFRGAVEKTFSTVLSVRKRCSLLHRKDMRQSVPVFPSQMVEIREILWVWKRKVIRQTTPRLSASARGATDVSQHGPHPLRVLLEQHTARAGWRAGHGGARQGWPSLGARWRMPARARWTAAASGRALPPVAARRPPGTVPREGTPCGAGG